MEIITDPGPCPDKMSGCAVTIGAYDGVHAGHRQVIDRVKQVAAEAGLSSAVVTFDQHPAQILRPDHAPKILCSLEQKLQLLGETGVDKTAVIQFDKERAAEPAEDFVKRVLVGCLGAKAIVVGEDFHFGRGRRGDVALLREMGSSLGFEVQAVKLFEKTGEPVSSTRIRALIAGGNVEAASSLLVRNYEVRGIVEHGDGRGGAELGYPTANISVSPERALPALGIYAGWYLRPDGARHPCAISLGERPTFYKGGATAVLEAHLIDFDGQLYGESASIQFVARLRKELRFETSAELVAQMALDVIATRQVLAIA